MIDGLLIKQHLSDIKGADTQSCDNSPKKKCHAAPAVGSTGFTRRCFVRIKLPFVYKSLALPATAVSISVDDSRRCAMSRRLEAEMELIVASCRSK